MFTYPILSSGSRDVMPSLLTDLVAWYDYEEASGTRFDATGNHDLPGSTEQGITQQVAGVSTGYGLYTPQADGYDTSVGSGALSWGAKDATICVWLKAASLAPTYAHAITVQSSQLATGNSVGIGINNTDEWRVWYGTAAGTWEAQVQSGVITTDVWYFIHAWYETATGTLGIQINDQTPTSGGTSNPPNDLSASAPMIVGYQPSFPVNGYAGSLDSQGHWDRLLTAEEVTWLYNSGNGRQYADIS